MSTEDLANPSSSLNSLVGRVAVVTGASSGIGAATAKLLAAKGAKVALLARRKSKLDPLAAEIEAAGGVALAVEVDVTCQNSVDAAARTVDSEMGRASIVINNAGVMLPAPIEQGKIDDWQAMIDLNLMGVMRIIKGFTAALARSAATAGVADLVTISSIGARNVFPSFSVYCASKAAVTHLSLNLRAELGPKDVRVSVIEPGFVETELASHVQDEAAKDWIAGSFASMEVLKAEDIATLIAFTVGLPKRVNLPQLMIMPTHQV